MSNVDEGLNVNEAVVRYIAVWNERDLKRRRDLVTKTFSEDASYIDERRNGTGHEAIDALIAKTQEQFPGYKLSLVSGIEAHHNLVRFSWAAGGTAEAPLYLGGTDFISLARDGRIKSVAGFVDAAPVHK